MYTKLGLTVPNGTHNTVGNNVIIGCNITSPAASHPVDSISEISMDEEIHFIAAPIAAEGNMQIWANTVILANMSIGKGSIAKARNVVNRDYSPWLLCPRSPL